MIYADNAATTKLDKEAYIAMEPYLLDLYGNPSQPYSFSRDTRKALKESRELIARCIGAEPGEIFFTSGGTESDNWALTGYTRKHKGTEIIVSPIEHHAVLNTVESLKRERHKVHFLEVSQEGVVQVPSLKTLINPKVSLVSVMLANNEIGSIQPVRELAEIAHENGAVFHTDAVQAVGHIVIDVKKLEVDMMSASAHKFNGPRGIGFLYIRKGIVLSPLLNGGNQEMKMRAGTENVPAIVGMATALRNSCNSIASESVRLRDLEDKLLCELSRRGVDFIRNGADGHLPGNISLSFRNQNGEMLLHRLDLLGISVSTGAACDSENTNVSHVLKAIGVPSDYSKGTIRISFGKNNTIDDAITIADALCAIVL